MPAASVINSEVLEEARRQMQVCNACRYCEGYCSVFPAITRNKVFASGDITVPVSQRVILNHITAKRLLGLLSATLQRHEQAFGVVETDVRRRVRPQG